MYFFDGWRVHPTLSPATYHAPKKRQSEISLMPHPQLVRNQPGRQKKKRETSLRQPPRIRRKMGQIQDGQLSAHVKYLRAMVNQYGSIIHEVHEAARIHTQMSKGTAGSPQIIAHKEESSQSYLQN